MCVRQKTLDFRHSSLTCSLTLKDEQIITSVLENIRACEVDEDGYVGHIARMGGMTI
jgi:hypothetical protein